MPAASVLMTVYNCERYVEAAVRGALAQSLEDLELVVVDDGSTDRSAEILEGISDRRLRVLRRDRDGHSRALNAGLAACASGYVAILDADDLSLPDRLAAQIDFLDDNPTIALVGSRYRTKIDGDDRPIGEDVLPLDRAGMVRDLRRAVCPLFHSSVMYRKEAVLALGGYDEDLVCLKDVDLYVRLMRASGRPNIANMDVRLALKRIHSGQFFGPQNGVRESGEGRRAAETLSRRILEAFGPPVATKGW